MKYEHLPLPYVFDALEPVIDAKTMEIHHSKHHATYVEKTNALLEKYPAFADTSLENLLKNLNTLEMDEADRKVLRNQGGGAWNHTFFWNVMGPKKEVDESLVKEIEKTFGSLDAFKQKFSDVAKTQFASGWAWLARDGEGKLQVYNLPNQDSPLTLGHTPILTLDVWEHAYYLKYQNRRADFVDAWWQVCKIIP